MSNVSFTTEQDYIVARDAALEVLKTAQAAGTIRVEWTFPEGGQTGSKLERLAFDIVSAIARSNIPVTGDISDGMIPVDFQFVS